MESVASHVFAALSLYLSDEEVRRDIYEIHRRGNIVLVLGAPILRAIYHASPTEEHVPADEECLILPLEGEPLAKELELAKPESHRKLGLPYDPKRIRILYRHDEDASIVETFTVGAEDLITN